MNLKLFPTIILMLTMLAAIACGSSAAPNSDQGEAIAPTATSTPVPTRDPTIEPTISPTSTQAAEPTVSPTNTQGTEPTATQTIVPETISEAAKTTNPRVAIVDRGDLGAQAKERITVQLAIDSMMVGNLLSKITVNGTADYIRAEGIPATDTDFGGGQYIVGYTREAFSHYCYTWDSNGTILTQLEPGTPPCGVTP